MGQSNFNWHHIIFNSTSVAIQLSPEVFLFLQNWEFVYLQYTSEFHYLDTYNDSDVCFILHDITNPILPSHRVPQLALISK